MNRRSGPSRREMMNRLARVAVHVGANLRPEQELLLSAPVEAIDFVRMIACHAYAAGASHVSPTFTDDALTLARFKHAEDHSFDIGTGWLYDGMAAAMKAGAARIAIVGEDPSLLSGFDPDRVSRATKARNKAFAPCRDIITGFQTNWSLTAYAGKAWARSVFPNDPPAVAQAKLWDTIFTICRIDRGKEDCSIENWEEHNRVLHRRAKMLTDNRFTALHFTAPGTDLFVYLADNHAWVGGSAVAQNGIACNANVPTEEVFTTPHGARTHGYVSSSKPLSYNGSMIDGIHVVFEEGRVVNLKARLGQEAFEKMVGTDEGSARVGEVALVPHSSPISQSGLLFNNTLFDENAASHLAMGQSYTKCFLDPNLEWEAHAAAGANKSNVHCDWMFGRAETNVDGIDQNGNAIPIMRNGEFVDFFA